MKRFAVLLLALAACTRAGTPPASQADAGAALLRTASTVEVPGWNPMIHDNAYSFYYAPLIFDYLTAVDAKSTLQPDLAVAVPSYENGGISGDGRTVTYHLRRGVRWQDGAPFDARDVLFSYRAAMNPENPVPDRTGYDEIARIAAPDPYTVVVRLKRAFTPFVPSFLSSAANDGYPVLPAHVLARERSQVHDAFDGAPVGTGPFRLVRWQRGQRAVFAANDRSWRGRPGLRRIEIAFVADSNTLANIFRTGAVDMREMRTGNGAAFYQALSTTPNTQVSATDHYELNYYLINQTRPPFDDVRVRRALIEGFDRRTAMRELQGPLALPGETDRLPGQFAYDPSIREPGYDPAAAARALDEAGWRLAGDGVRRKHGRVLAATIVGTAENKTGARLDLLLQQALKKLGFDAEVKPYAYDQLWAPKSEHGVYATQNFDLSYSGWQPNAVNDHSYLFRCDTRPPNGDNYGGICDPAIDAAARRELAATSPAVEAAADRALTRRVVEQSDIFFLGFDREAIAAREGLTGFAPAVSGMHTWNAWQWRWTRP